MTASLLTYREAAEQLHASERTARRLAAGGHLTKVRVAPNTVRVRADSVAHLIEHGYGPPAAAQEAR